VHCKYSKELDELADNEQLYMVLEMEDYYADELHMFKVSSMLTSSVEFAEDETGEQLEQLGPLSMPHNAQKL
jgi:hypothetical protein